jgi:hypothetical protein
MVNSATFNMLLDSPMVLSSPGPKSVVFILDYLFSVFSWKESGAHLPVEELGVLESSIILFDEDLVQGSGV